MSFPQVTPHFYEMFVPDEPWHQGSAGWSTSPWPGWGNNPNLVGLPRLAVHGLGTDAPPSAPPAAPPPPAKLGVGALLIMALAGVGGYYGARACFGQKSFMANKRRHRRNTRRRSRSSWGSVSYVPKTVRTRAQAHHLAMKTGERVRFTEDHGGFVQPPSPKR